MPEDTKALVRLMISGEGSLKKLVGSWNDEWLDMSPFVVHFTRESDGRSPLDNVISILDNRRIEARTRFGSGKDYAASPKFVCFSEIPLHLLSRLAKKRGCFGIGFTKEYLVSRDGGPILYAYKDTPHAKAVRHLVDKAAHEPHDPIWKVAPFVDQPGEYGNTKYFFEWEREWRHVGNLAFNEKDAAFLIIPEEDHTAARDFFDLAEEENSGPNYKCPFIDPFWSQEQVKDAFNDAKA